MRLEDLIDGPLRGVTFLSTPSEHMDETANTLESYDMHKAIAKRISWRYRTRPSEQMQMLLYLGHSFWSANRIGAALAAFYEAELVEFHDKRLVAIRKEFGRPGVSFDDIARDLLEDT